MDLKSHIDSLARQVAALKVELRDAKQSITTQQRTIRTLTVDNKALRLRLSKIKLNATVNPNYSKLTTLGLSPSQARLLCVLVDAGGEYRTAEYLNNVLNPTLRTQPNKKIISVMVHAINKRLGIPTVLSGGPGSGCGYRANLLALNNLIHGDPQ